MCVPLWWLLTKFSKFKNMSYNFGTRKAYFVHLSDPHSTCQCVLQSRLQGRSSCYSTLQWTVGIQHHPNPGSSAAPRPPLVQIDTLSLLLLANMTSWPHPPSNRPEMTHQESRISHVSPSKPKQKQVRPQPLEPAVLGMWVSTNQIPTCRL